MLVYSECQVILNKWKVTSVLWTNFNNAFKIYSYKMRNNFGAYRNKDWVYIKTVSLGYGPFGKL